jgi:hypothetical protein
MQTLILKSEDVEFLGSTLRVMAKVNLKPLAESQLALTDEGKARILAQIPTARFDDIREPEDLRGTEFTIRNPLTGEDDIFSHDDVMNAFPDVDFDTVTLEYESHVAWVGGEIFTPQEYEAELMRRGLRP